MQLWRPLADHGVAEAQFGLGVLYAKGVPQDYAAAVGWYRKAADQGFTFAQFSLGFMYATGRGVPQDYVRAYMWTNLAAARGVSDAIESLNIIASKMSPAQIAEAQKLASEWKPKPS
jgi:TPR repeat protein